MDLKEEVVNMKKEVKEVKNQSLAREMLEDYKKQNLRLYRIIIVILILWFITGCYLVYILNDIGTIEETTRTQEISEVDSIDNSNIVNGDMNGENKTDKKDN